MSDNEIDNDLLALADESSDSEPEDTNQEPPTKKSKSTSPAPPPPPATQPTKVSPPTKGVAQRKSTKSSRPSAPSRGRQREDSEEGEASSAAASPDSLGSGAMSESESEGEAVLPTAGVDAATIFPVDGIFRSEKEKEDIHAMPEIERERLLAERAEEAEKLKQSAQLRTIMQAREKTEAAQKKRKATSADLDDSPRKARSAKTKQSENLAAYKRQREQRNEERKRGDERKTKDRMSSQDKEHSEDEADEDVEWDDTPPKAAPIKEAPSLRDYERVKVGRSNFAECCFYPGFEDAVKGCFVRVAIGINKQTKENTYRMCQIKSFTKGRPYQMEGPANKRPFYTDQYAMLAHGKAEKEWPFIACSDSKITDEEFDRYMQTLAADELSKPTRTFLESKCDAIRALLNTQWTDEMVSAKLRRQADAQATVVNYNRERLEKQRKVAAANEDMAEVQRLDTELAALDDSKPGGAVAFTATAKPLTAPKAPSQQDRLAALNRANRKANAEEIRKAQIEERRRQEEQKKAMLRGEAVVDRFARVKTRVKVHYDANGNDSLRVPKKVDDLFGEVSDTSRAATPAAESNRNGIANTSGTPKASTPKPEKGGAGGLSKKVMDDEVLGAIDLGIEIDI